MPLKQKVVGSSPTVSTSFMNIFVLDNDPSVAARMHVNKHVVKMILETAQILCSAFESAPYRRTHYNHPCCIWARESRENFLWLVKLGKALHDEYQYRYGNKTHKSYSVILWCESHIDEISFIKNELTPFAQAMPAQYRNENAVLAYRKYYLNDKKDILDWGNRENPEWVNGRSSL